MMGRISATKAWKVVARVVERVRRDMLSATRARIVRTVEGDFVRKGSSSQSRTYSNVGIDSGSPKATRTFTSAKQYTEVKRAGQRQEARQTKPKDGR
eukprot:scaffold11604_cov73-Skeletonema_marinoi.AAC.1